MKGSHIFAQATSLIDWDNFAAIVKRRDGDKFVKAHGCRELLTTMLFAHIAGADSLREISQGMQSHGGSLSHLGISKPIGKSSLADGLAKRPWEVFRDMFEHLVETLGKDVASGPLPNGIRAKLFSVDSTTIDLCLSMFEWAKFHHGKGAVKIHTVLDHDGLLPVFAHVSEGSVADVRAFKQDVLPRFAFPKGSVVAIDRGYVDYGLFADLSEKGVFFVTRRKENAAMLTTRNITSDPYDLTDGGRIVRDELVTPASGQHAGLQLRLVHVVTADKRSLVLCTNHLKWAASTIAEIYKQRWQVELFFKQLKQNLKIKSFVATSENAVKVQIYSALCAVVLMRYLKHVSDSRRSKRGLPGHSFSNLATMLRINLLQFHGLEQWLENPFLPPPETVESDQLELDVFGQHRQGEGGVLARGAASGRINAKSGVQAGVRQHSGQ